MYASPRFRIAVLSFFLLFAVLNLPNAGAYLRKSWDDLMDRYDRRPALNILFIGNSHTAHHNVPGMVRKLADSAGSAYKYVIEVHAPGGATLGDHWRNPQVQGLLKRKWDYVVLQGGSSETFLEAGRERFFANGAPLAQQVITQGGKPVLYVTWPYEDSYEFVREYPVVKGRMDSMLQNAYRDLADETGAALVNVGGAWEALRREARFPLYEDGNHATIHGSYLAAVMFYRFFSGGDATRATYVPSGISEEEAQLIRRVAARY